MATESQIKSRPGQVLKQFFINRDFGLLWTGRLVSQLGDGIHYFALAWLVYDLTGSGTILGTLLMVSSLPGILLTPFTGVLSDMLSRRHIIIFMDLLRGVVMLLLAAAVWQDRLTIGLLYPATILLALAGTLFWPAISATIPGLVRPNELVKANARDTMLSSVTGLLGPLAGGLLLARFGYIGVFLVNGLSFLLSAGSECFIRFPKQIHHPSEKPAATFFDNLKGGFQFLWQQPGLRLIIAGGIVLNFLMNPIFSVVLPYLGKELMRMTPGQYSLSQIGFPLGMLLGTLIVSAVARRVRQYQMLTVGVRLHGFLLLPLSLLSIPLVWTRFSPWILPLLLAIPLFLTGIVNVQINVPLNVMMQQTVPDHYRGRVFSLFGSLLNMAAPVGMALFGILTDTIPVYFLLIVCGLVIVAMASVLARPALRNMCRENEQRDLRHTADSVISQ